MLGKKEREDDFVSSRHTVVLHEDESHYDLCGLISIRDYMRTFIDVYLLKLLLIKTKPYAIDIIPC